MTLTAEQQEDFLVALADSGRIHEACETSGVTTTP